MVIAAKPGHLDTEIPVDLLLTTMKPRFNA
jgi:hypothetical protein